MADLKKKLASSPAIYRFLSAPLEYLASKRDHLNRTRAAGAGGLVGGVVGSFLGLPGAAIGAGLGALLGAWLGSSQDPDDDETDVPSVSEVVNAATGDASDDEESNAA